MFLFPRVSQIDLEMSGRAPELKLDVNVVPHFAQVRMKFGSWVAVIFVGLDGCSVRARGEKLARFSLMRFCNYVVKVVLSKLFCCPFW